MGRYADPSAIPVAPRLPGPDTDPAGRADGLIRLMCYSTEPGDDPVAQVRAGAFEVAHVADPDAEPAGCQGIVLVELGDGRVRGQGITAPDLFCLAGYPEASHCPGDLVFTVGHRAAATQILRAAGIAWHGDHVVLRGTPEVGLLNLFLETLHHLAAHNLAALASGASLIGWRDVFPGLRIQPAKPRGASHPGG